VFILEYLRKIFISHFTRFKKLY